MAKAPARRVPQCGPPRSETRVGNRHRSVPINRGTSAHPVHFVADGHRYYRMPYFVKVCMCMYVFLHAHMHCVDMLNTSNLLVETEWWKDSIAPSLAQQQREKDL